MDSKAKKEVAKILKEFQVKDAESLYGMAGVHVALLYEQLKPIQEQYGLSEEDMEMALEEILL